MKKLIALGEALIDFIPTSCGKIQTVPCFEAHVGGAPCNVCGAFVRLGGKSAMITQLGEDPFGDKIIQELSHYGIDTSMIYRTDQANTSLAFVALDEQGNREFSFYRNPGADMLLNEHQIKPTWFKDCYALHFCSVSLGDFPMKSAHIKAIEAARKNDAFISFDPNIRLPLWKTAEQCRQAVLQFLPYANIIKISDEELEFITGSADLKTACDFLFQYQAQLILYTCGQSGAYAITPNSSVFEPALQVAALDTTGAGDGFIGSFLYQCARDEVNDFSQISEEQLHHYLRKSNDFCGKSVKQKGAISSYPQTLD